MKLQTISLLGMVENLIEKIVALVCLLIFVTGCSDTESFTDFSSVASSNTRDLSGTYKLYAAYCFDLNDDTDFSYGVFELNPNVSVSSTITINKNQFVEKMDMSGCSVSTSAAISFGKLEVGDGVFVFTKTNGIVSQVDDIQGCTMVRKIDSGATSGTVYPLESYTTYIPLQPIPNVVGGRYAVIPGTPDSLLMENPNYYDPNPVSALKIRTCFDLYEKK